MYIVVFDCPLRKGIKVKIAKFFLLFAILSLSACAGLEKMPWVNDPQQYEEVTVRWLRMPGKGFVDQDGVCNVQLVDSERGLEDFYPQMKACRKGAVRATATASMKKVEVKKIRIYAVKTYSDVQNRAIDIFGMKWYKAAANRSASSVCWQGIDCKGVVGFLFEGTGWDGIVIGQRYMSHAGHEMKHLYDGPYHYSSMHWKEPGKVFVPEKDPVVATPKLD